MSQIRQSIHLCEQILFFLHKLIVAAKESLTNKKPYKYDYVGMVDTTRGELDIRVALANVDRTMRIFDTLIKLLHARNHSIIIRNDKTYEVVKKVELKICLLEN